MSRGVTPIATHTMQPRPTGSKSRPAARKRLNADDSPFIGPSAGTKRGGDKVEGAVEPRAKRKRVEPQTGGLPGAFPKKTSAEGEPASALVRPLPAAARTPPTRCAQVDFAAMPVDALLRYLAQADAVPPLHPSLCSAENPPLPSSLLNPQATAPRAPSPAPTSTPANRPRRDVKDASRRRSSRLLEEEERSRRAPVLADAQAVHAVFATLAERQFEKEIVREADAMQQFLLAVKPR